MGEHLLETLQKTGQLFLNIVPNMLMALTVLVVGWLFSSIVSKIIERILRAIKVDKIGEKLNEIEMLERVKARPSKVIAKLIYYVMMLVFIAVASDMMQLEIVSNQVNSFIEYLPKILTATLILLAGLVVANMIKGILDTAFMSLNISSGRLISGFVFYFIFISVALSALTQASIETGFLKSNLTLIIGGVVVAFAIGYGLASKSMMANLLGALYSKSKFRIGDDVKINGVRGTVVEMDSTSITLLTSDRKVVFPLNIVTTEKVEVFGTWNENKMIEQ